MSLIPEEISNRFHALVDEIATRGKNRIDIIAVTKRHPVDIFSICETAGIKHIGENRVQELREKLDVASSTISKFKLHFIGALQTNKIKYIHTEIQSFDALSSSSQIHEFEKKRKDMQLPPVEVLLQINSTSEDQKSGLSLDDFNGILDMVDACIRASSIRLKGLMTMGPTPGPGFQPGNREYDIQTNAAFEKTRILFEQLQVERDISLSRLSMGMTHDYRIAIDQGATEIRVGSLLFGDRPA